MVSENEVRQNISANLRRLLAARGISLNKLSQMCGINYASLHGYYMGKNTPSAFAVARLAEALDVTVDRLIYPPPELSATGS